MKALAVIFVGLLLGVAAAAGDLSMGPDTSDAARVLFWLPNVGSVWVAAAFLSGAWFRSPWKSAVAGCAVLVAAVVAYYTFGLTIGDRTHVGLVGIGPTLLRWMVAAVVFGPLFGYLGFVFRRGEGSMGLAGALALPVVIIAEGAYQLLRESVRYRNEFGNDPWRDGVLVVMLGVGVLVAVLFVRRWRSMQVRSLARHPTAAEPSE